MISYINKYIYIETMYDIHAIHFADGRGREVQGMPKLATFVAVRAETAQILSALIDNIVGTEQKVTGHSSHRLPIGSRVSIPSRLLPP